MTDYSKITNFTAKDALTAGDPAKAVKGTDLDAELNAISVAILSKFDSVDLATQAEAEAGTDNTKLMTPLRAANWRDALDAALAGVKTATETVNNSSTLQDDDHIAGINLEASKTYRIFGVLYGTFLVASDWKGCLTFSSAPTTLLAVWNRMQDGGTYGVATQTTSGSSVSFSTLAAAGCIVVEGYVTTNAATVAKLQWAQLSAQSENTSLYAGSFISFQEL